MGTETGRRQATIHPVCGCWPRADCPVAARDRREHGAEHGAGECGGARPEERAAR